MSDLLRPLAGINRGFSLVGLRPRQPPKLTSVLVSNSAATVTVPAPTWCKWILLEALGGGGTASTDGSSGGGHAADRIIKNTSPSMVFNVDGTGPNGLTTVNVNSNTILYGYNGGTVNPDPYHRYLGGAFSGNRAPAYGCLNDTPAMSPTSYYTPYGIAGAGRLAGRLTSQTAAPGGAALGASRVSGSTGMGAVCLTFAEEKQQLIDFLNQHYKDGWGIDWRDLPTPSYHLLMSPWYGAWWS